MLDIIIKTNEEQEKLLEKRADELSKKVNIQEEITDKQDYLLLLINKAFYAIETSFVQEVHMNINPVKVPCTPEFIKGIVNIRGDIFSVTDISLFLGFKAIQTRNDYLMVRVKLNKLEFGILADEIEDIIHISPSDINPYVITGSNNKADKYIKGVTKKMVNVLNIDALLKNDQLIVNENVQ